MQLKNKTLGLTALAILASAGQALAVTFSGSTSGVFDNAVGDPGLVTTGQGTSSFTWGAINPGRQVNSLDFAGSDFRDIDCDVPFPIGTVTYFNGTTILGTNATAVDLLIDVTFTSPAGLVSFDYLLTLITTPNTTDPIASRDYISLPEVPSQSFTIAGQEYVLNLSFDGQREFFVFENESASTALVGQITCSKVPESGSSLALLGGGMLLISGVRRKMKAVK